MEEPAIGYQPSGKSRGSGLADRGVAWPGVKVWGEEDAGDGGECAGPDGEHEGGDHQSGIEQISLLHVVAPGWQLQYPKTGLDGRWLAVQKYRAGD